MTIDTISSPVEQSMPRGRVGLAIVWRGIFRCMTAFFSRSRSRQALSELTEDQLRDIGLTEDEARREARRSLVVRLDALRLPPF